MKNRTRKALSSLAGIAVWVIIAPSLPFVALIEKLRSMKKRKPKHRDGDKNRVKRLVRSGQEAQLTEYAAWQRYEEDPTEENRLAYDKALKEFQTVVEQLDVRKKRNGS